MFLTHFCFQEMVDISGNTSGTQVGSAPTPTSSDIQLETMLEGPSQARPQAPLGPPQDPTQAGIQVITSQDKDTQPSPQEVLKRKPTRPPSNAWLHFTRENDRATCIYCKKIYACNASSHGTTNLLKHLRTCEKNPNREFDKKQKTIVLGKQCEGDSETTVGMKLEEFNQEKPRFKLAKMITVDELPFRFVENQGFRDFMSEAQPRFKIPSRITIARDCMELYEEKERLKSILSKNHQMVSLTTDTWTSIQNVNYMCVTVHYVDDGWELNKKILSFGLITDHKGETIGKALEKCLKDWGILKVCCVTVDNASANNVAIAYLARSMSDSNGLTLFSGEFIHMRCCAHILNLIVTDGLKEFDSSLSKIITSCKYVKSSPARLATFKRCTREANITSRSMSDWNGLTLFSGEFIHMRCCAHILNLIVTDGLKEFDSSLSKIRASCKYVKSSPARLATFKRCSREANITCKTMLTVDVPTAWNSTYMMLDIAEKFEKAFMRLEFDDHFCMIALDIEGEAPICGDWSRARVFVKFLKVFDDVTLSFSGSLHVTSNTFFHKLCDIQKQLSNLRQSNDNVLQSMSKSMKLVYVEFCFQRMYGIDMCKEMVKKLKELIFKLFEYYTELHLIPIDSFDSRKPASSATLQSQINNEDEAEEGWEDEFRLKVKKKDILAIPVSTVSSESAFSTEGRVLDPFRNSLHPSTVEALICTQNWLRNPSREIDIRAALDEVEKVESGHKMKGEA
ncbi:HAT family dimerization domain-containing protein [Canna indica]|uniref:HAT family dimerization domain-containing protein n=1 Tax=Canna indica TaxID=4628 RepID=A0AAQ3Q8B4_9LILI|nr:HAT family dimerization domain-containing protein [Canna indica]